MAHPSLSPARAAGRLRSRLPNVLVAMALAGALVGVASPAHATTSDEDWLLTSQLPDGAIAQFPDLSRINPYLANYAAIGLAHSYATLHNTTYLNAAWSWLTWYQGHMNANGYVTDYTVGPPPTYTETSTGDEDSTDGYAGTFILALNEAYNVSGNKTKLKTYTTGLTNAINAIHSTQQSDGLTWAKPTFQAKFLMDNAEAYAGLRAGATLAGVLGKTALKNNATSYAASMKTGIGTMWDATDGLYYVAKNSDGTFAATTWSYYYPDSAAQAWAVALGNWLTPGNALVASARASTLMSTFTTDWPQWSQPGATVQFNSGPHTVDYWPLIGGALISVGRSSDGTTGTSAIDSYASTNGRPWPFSVASGGQVIEVLGS